MTPEQYERIGELFERACELPVSERQKFIEDTAADDDVVLRKVVSMLSIEERSSGIFDTPALGPQFHVGQGIEAPHPESIGRYRVESLLGEGGMGRVYRCQQENPRRPVAVKLLRSGLASSELLTRFRVEAHALGRLHHPGIAQIYEAGTFDTGVGTQPFLAMEYVEGRPLLRYAQEESLDVDARLGLVLKLCDAVQHAHQRGIIHRDLKPDNILVDNSGQAKVLDFGVARITDTDAQVTRAQTGAGQLVGTLAYMSPEQVSSGEADVRSDVYALGVIVFELLTGELPYPIGKKTLHEAVRIIAEQQPGRLGVVDPQLRGDLSTVVAKALEKDPARRYQSVPELRADIERYLRHEPIAARPTTARYQLRMFARRNRGLVGVSLAAVGLLVAVTGVATWQAVIATRARDLAQREAAKFEASQDFLIREMLFGATPDVAQGGDVSLRDILARAAERVGVALADQPEVEAAVRHTLSEVYGQIGEFPEAVEQARRAIELRERVLGPDAVDTLRSVIMLCSSLKRQGLLEEADPLQVRAYEGLLAALGPRDPEVMDAKNNLGALRNRQHRYTEAEQIHRELMDLRQSLGMTDDPHLYYSMHNLATSLDGQDRHAEALELYRQAIEGKKRVEGPKHPSTLISMMNYDITLVALGRYEEAIPSCRATLALAQEVYGPDHSYIAHSLTALGDALMLRGKAGDWGEAAAVHYQALEIWRATLVEGHWRAGATLAQLGRCQLRMGEEDKAEASLKAGFKILGPETGRGRDAAGDLARLYESQGREAEAMKWRRRAAQ